MTSYDLGPIFLYKLWFRIAIKIVDVVLGERVNRFDKIFVYKLYIYLEKIG